VYSAILSVCHLNQNLDNVEFPKFQYDYEKVNVRVMDHGQ
jgi:hypothetical protein